MHTEEHFFAAIEESRQEGFLKLAFADWLEEQGDARADVIRMIENGELHECIGPPEAATIHENHLSESSQHAFAIELVDLAIPQCKGFGQPLARWVPRCLCEEDDHLRYIYGSFVGKLILQFEGRVQRNELNVNSSEALATFALVDIVSMFLYDSTHEERNLGSAAEHLANSLNDPQKQWDWNLLRLAEHQHFSGRKLWTT